MLLIPLCPLSKIFIPSQWAPLTQNPELVYQEADFPIQVSTSRKDYLFRFKKPRIEQDAVLCYWLTGGEDCMQVQETDWTGIVPLDLEDDLNSAILSSLATGEKLDKDLQTALNRAKAKAKELSYARVMRQIRAVHSNMLRQVEINKESGNSFYNPSPVELLCTFVLAQEKQKEAEARRQISEKFKELLQQSMI